jgi:hypothetical protein
VVLALLAAHHIFPISRIKVNSMLFKQKEHCCVVCVSSTDILSNKFLRLGRVSSHTLLYVYRWCCKAVEDFNTSMCHSEKGIDKHRIPKMIKMGKKRIRWSYVETGADFTYAIERRTKYRIFLSKFKIYKKRTLKCGWSNETDTCHQLTPKWKSHGGLSAQYGFPSLYFTALLFQLMRTWQ